MRTRKAVKTLAKLAVVTLLFYVLARKGLLSVSETGRAFTKPGLMLPGLAAVLATYFLAAIRWQGLLRAQGFRLSWVRAFQLSFVGNFFNVALPGSVSGDVVKAYYISKESEGQASRAFATILFDRVAGLAALVMVSATALALFPEAFGRSVLFAGIRISVIATALGFLSFFVFLFSVSETADPVLRVLQAVEARKPRAAALTRVYSGVRHYRAQPFAVARALLISALNHVLTCSAGILFARALGAEGLEPGAVFAVVPLGFLVTAIPIMPAGIGTGHLAFSALFGALGFTHGADLFNIYVLVQLLSAAVGGLVYLSASGKTGLAEIRARAGS